MLVDIALQLGIPIDGEAITRFTSGDLVSSCQHLVGATPHKNVVLGNIAKLS